MSRLRTAACALVLVGAGCTTAAAPVARQGDQPTTDVSAAERAYGRAPVAGAGVRFKPDVVLVGGGAAMVREVSGDSQVWSIDSRAKHIDELSPGKVMFLTGRAVGRVLRLEHRPGIVAVTLGPVDLTDVISDGNVDVNSSLEGAPTLQAFPGMRGVVTTPTSGPQHRPAPAWARGSAALSAPLAPSAPHVGEPPMPLPSTGSSVEVSAGDFAVEIGSKTTGEEHEYSLKVSYEHEGVTVGVEFAVTVEKPHLEAHLSFAGGALGRNELRMDGVKLLSVRLVSGSEKGLSGNFKSRIEVPAEMSYVLPAGPVPLTASVRFKFIVETAFSARNATLGATGTVKLDGPAGFSGSNVFLPTVTPQKKPIDNVTGVSVGVNGVVFAAQMKVLIGLGIPAALAGPFVAFTISYGITNGSSIGIVQCKQTSLDVLFAYGIGFTLNPNAYRWVEQLGREIKGLPKVDSEFANHTKTLKHQLEYKPPVVACHS